jgi:xanthine/CO dehydrogenase XdhC/CoxF family maturation factor
MLLEDDCCMLRAIMSVREIVETFGGWRARGEPIVLATVYDTIGSTYTKAGHRILISGTTGDYRGLVSGGCLEGDLAKRARDVIASGEARAVTYDMRDEADDLWGLGIGCNGLLRVFLQPLTAERDYQPFAAIAECLLANRLAGVATVIESESSAACAGATVLWTPDRIERWGLDERLAAELAAGCERAVAAGAAEYRVGAEGLAVLYAPLRPVPRLLILGAGLDAVPLVGMAAELGWLVTVADHRPAYIDRGRFDRAERVLAIDPRSLREQLPLEDFDAIVVMSHHLATDRLYLQQLADSTARYLGLLGPAKRRERLVGELGDASASLASRLRGPVGLDIGADSPESIALSLLAEIHATLAGATGRALTAS